jgi:hypothetical protein
MAEAYRVTSGSPISHAQAWTLPGSRPYAADE